MQRTACSALSHLIRDTGGAGQNLYVDVIPLVVLAVAVSFAFDSA